MKLLGILTSVTFCHWNVDSKFNFLLIFDPFFIAKIAVMASIYHPLDVLWNIYGKSFLCGLILARVEGVMIFREF